MQKIFKFYNENKNNLIKGLVLTLLIVSSVNFPVQKAKADSCVVNSFGSYQNPVASGGFADLYWTQTGCAYLELYADTGGFVGDVLTTSYATSDTYRTGSLAYPGPYGFYLQDPNGSPVGSISISVAQGGNNCLTSNFTSPSLSITSGNSATLTWTASNCGSLSIDQGIGDVTGLTQKSTGPLTSTTTFTLTGGASPLSVTITVAAASACAINSFYANPNPVSSFAPTSKLYWTTSNCSALELIDVTNGTFVSVQLNNPTDGYSVTIQNTSQDYYLDAGSPQVPQQTVTVTKTNPCTISGQQATVNGDKSVTITFNLSSCTNATIKGGSLTAGGSGTVAYTSPSSTTNYTGPVSISTGANEVSSSFPTMTYYIDAWSTAPNGTVAAQQSATATLGPTCRLSINRRINYGLAPTVSSSTPFVYSGFGGQKLSGTTMNDEVVVCSSYILIGFASQISTTAVDSNNNPIVANIKSGASISFDLNSANTSQSVIVDYQTPAKIEVK